MRERAASRPRRDPDPARGRVGPPRQARLERANVCRRRRQPARRGSRGPDAAGRRQRGRRRDRRADGAHAGRAAVERHRRRRVPAALRRPRRRGLRRARDGACRRRREPLRRRRRQADAVPRRGRRRACGRRARRAADAGNGAPPARPARMVRALPTGDRAGRRRLRGEPPAARAARRRAVAAPRPGRRRLLLRPGRPAVAERAPAQESRTRAGAARHRRRRFGGAARGPGGRGDRGQGAQSPDQPRPAGARRPRGLPAEAARRAVLRLPGAPAPHVRRVRLPAAGLGRHRHRPDPRHPERNRGTHPRARQRDPRRRVAALLHRGGAPGLRRPRPVRRRPRFRRPAGRELGEPARSRLPRRARTC